MSEASYQLNMKRGVTGPWSDTCLMAAYDRISPVTGISTQTYERHQQLRERFVEGAGDAANFVPQDIASEFSALKLAFRNELGVPTDKNVIEARVNSEAELRDKLARLTVGGFRTAVYLDVGGLHAVGVKGEMGDDFYDVRSTWTPFPSGEPVSTSELFEYIDLAPRQRTRTGSSRKTEPASNIVAIPAEPKGCRPPYPGL